jgi:hypothetical protein
MPPIERGLVTVEISEREGLAASTSRWKPGPAEDRPGHAQSVRPLVNPDSNPRADRRKQAKRPKTADQPGLEHIIRLLHSKHK